MSMEGTICNSQSPHPWRKEKLHGTHVTEWRLCSQGNDLQRSTAMRNRVADPHTQGPESDTQSVDWLILLLLKKYKNRYKSG